MKLLIVLFSLVAFCSAQIFVTDCLLSHNIERSKVGDLPLIWDAALAASSQAYAIKLAATGTFKHSGTPGVGENLALGTSERYSTGYNTTALIKLWLNEKKNYIEGCTYPDCGSGVGHYTQMIWAKTKTVGCGKGTDGSIDILVCQYFPPGNYIGEEVN